MALSVNGRLWHSPSTAVSGHQWLSPAPRGPPQRNEARECLRKPQGNMRASKDKAARMEQETAVSCRSQSMAISGHLQQSLAVPSQCRRGMI
jgi:hypothetical protein